MNSTATIFGYQDSRPVTLPSVYASGIQDRPRQQSTGQTTSHFMEGKLLVPELLGYQNPPPTNRKELEYDHDQYPNVLLRISWVTLLRFSESHPSPEIGTLEEEVSGPLHTFDMKLLG